MTRAKETFLTVARKYLATSGQVHEVSCSLRRRRRFRCGSTVAAKEALLSSNFRCCRATSTGHPHFSQGSAELLSELGVQGVKLGWAVSDCISLAVCARRKGRPDD